MQNDWALFLLLHERKLPRLVFLCFIFFLLYLCFSFSMDRSRGHGSRGRREQRTRRQRARSRGHGSSWLIASLSDALPAGAPGGNLSANFLQERRVGKAVGMVGPACLRGGQGPAASLFLS